MSNTDNTTQQRVTFEFNQAANLFRRMYTNLSYNTIYQHLIKHITNGGTLGFNPVSRWSADGRGKESRKYKMLQHIFNTYGHDKILAAYEAQVAAGRVNERFRDGGGQGHGGDRPEGTTRQRRTNAQGVQIDNDVDPNTGAEITDDAEDEAAEIPQQASNVDVDQLRHIARTEARSEVNRLRADIEARHCVTVNVHNTRTNETQNMGVQHRLFPTLLQFMESRYPVWLPGPAGSGKTTAAMHAARALGLDFHSNGAVDTEYKLLGFTDAGGRFHDTPFYRAYANGGVYLFDEVDASNPTAMVAMNAAIENKYCVFGDGVQIEMHPDMYIIAAANTFGGGATHDYVGRNKLDAATVDRFVMLEWDYDENLERALAGNDEWVAYVQRIRAIVRAQGIKHVVSPRASLRGARMLAANIARDVVINATVRKGMSNDQWQQITRGM